MHALEIAHARPDAPADDCLSRLLGGYRFTVCQDAAAIAEAIDIRRRVYVGGNGYDIPVPDAYDHRSWHLLAEDVERGVSCGSMRLTPRSAGPIEAEEYFRLPAALRRPGTVELSRFAILPEYRKGKTFLPIVSVGLFAMVRQVLDREGVRCMAICAKPERIWTFEWLRFERTGLRTRYEKLGGAEHELLACDVRRASENLDAHPFGVFLDGRPFPELVVPANLPTLGLLGAYDAADDEPLDEAKVA